MIRHRQRKRPMHDINVVPYIDVMLVLLVIFMITAPLLAQGVKVDLPQASAEPLPPEQTEPVIVSVTADGEMMVNIGETQDQPVEPDILVARVAAVLQHKPGTPVLVKGDRHVDYARVIDTMVLLQRAGAPSVGLMTQPVEEGGG